MNPVAITLATIPAYPQTRPFHPSESYPECPFPQRSKEENSVYSAVREGLFKLGLDHENYGTKSWNPFGKIIQPGQKVVIKPNFVHHSNVRGFDPLSVITHGSVIRAVMDFVYIALNGRGEIIVADAPQMSADFLKIITQNGIDKVVQFYQEVSTIPVSLRDLRRERTIYRHGMIWERHPLAGDPEGYSLIDLGNASVMTGIDSSKLYGADYQRKETISAHSEGRHQYLIANTYLHADAVIHIPKLKTHCKAGITVNLKGMVGLCGNKNLIPHYQVGTNKQGGDEFSKAKSHQLVDRWIKDHTLGRNWIWGRYVYLLWHWIQRTILRSPRESSDEKGDWHGNDTVWRSALDLTRIIQYADKNGNVQPVQQRNYFSVVDGILAGEAEGPLGPTPRADGVILCGENPVAVDWAAAKWMKFDPMKIHAIRNAFQLDQLKLICSDPDDILLCWGDGVEESHQNIPGFVPPKGWATYL